MNAVELTDAEFARCRALIYKEAGIRVAETKRLLVSNRVRRRLKATGLPTFSAYLTHLTSAAGKAEMAEFLDVVTTNETYFFRDRGQYDWLRDELIPELVADVAARRRARGLRIWSAACSTGEEPYSMACCLAARRAELAGWRLAVLGTDLSGTALDAARKAEYADRALHLVGPDERKAFFDHDPAAGLWAVKPEVRVPVSFRRHNLMQQLGGEPFDCVFLKNVLIYFDAASKQAVADVVTAALAPGGRLVLGPTEGVHSMLRGLERLKPWLYRKAT